jgi:hypothetical protein
MTTFINIPYVDEHKMEGRTLGRCLLVLLFFNIAKKELDSSNVVYPKWINMKNCNSTENLDIAPEILDFPSETGATVNNLMFHKIWSSDRSNIDMESEYTENESFRNWLSSNIVSEFQPYLMFRTWKFTQDAALLALLKQKWNDTGITVKQSIIDSANSYINSTIGSDYISIGIRTGGYLYFHNNSFGNVTITDDIYQDRLNQSKTYLSNNIGSINNIYIASESLKTITDFIDLCKADSTFDGKNYFYHSDVIRRQGSGISSEADTSTTYSSNETISYYQNCMEDLLILGGGTKILAGKSTFHNLAKILFSDNSIENLIFMNYDNISEEVDGTDYKAISSIVSAGEIWEETNSPY